MSNLKQQLIRLGAQQPSLRRHLRPILDKIKSGGPRTSSRRKRAKDVFEKARERDSVIGEGDVDEIPDSELNQLERDITKIVEDGLSRFNLRETKQVFKQARSAIYKLYQKYERNGVDLNVLEPWVDRAEKGVREYLRRIFEELTYEAQDADDEWAESMADEYWEIAQEIHRRM